MCVVTGTWHEVIGKQPITVNTLQKRDGYFNLAKVISVAAEWYHVTSTLSAVLCQVPISANITLVTLWGQPTHCTHAIVYTANVHGYFNHLIWLPQLHYSSILPISWRIFFISLRCQMLREQMYNWGNHIKWFILHITLETPYMLLTYVQSQEYIHCKKSMVILTIVISVACLTSQHLALNRCKECV